MNYPIMETLEHNGFKIIIEHDQDATHLNPLTEDYSSGVSSLIWSDNGLTEYNGGIALPTFTKAQIKGNEQAIAEVLEYTDYAQMRENFRADDWTDEELVNKAIDHFTEWSLNSEHDKLDLFHDLLILQGYKCLKTRGHGHVQRDWHEILLAMAPDKICEFGDPGKALRSLAGEYTKWAYGDVHGYRVVKGRTCECCGHTEYEDVDSCWGFICAQGDESWTDMIEQAKQACTE